MPRLGSREPSSSTLVHADAIPHERAGADETRARILVAGVGNIFLGDDGFGVEVVRRLAHMSMPEGVRVADFGIRGLHLAYELLERQYETTILVDATPRGGLPGTVYLIEPTPETLAGTEPAVADAHSMSPQELFRLLRTLGGIPGHVLIVGCEPSRTAETLGLSGPVERAVDQAVELIQEVVGREAASRASAGRSVAEREA